MTQDKKKKKNVELCKDDETSSDFVNFSEKPKQKKRRSGENSRLLIYKHRLGSYWFSTFVMKAFKCPKVTYLGIILYN